MNLWSQPKKNNRLDEYVDVNCGPTLRENIQLGALYLSRPHVVKKNVTGRYGMVVILVFASQNYDGAIWIFLFWERYGMVFCSSW